MESVQIQSQETGPEAPVEPTPVESSDRPQWLPEKFADAEAMATAYAELESKQAQGTEPTPALEATTEEAPKGIDTDAAMQPFFEEYAKDGALSEDSYAKLAEQHNVPKDMVDDYIAMKNTSNAADSDAQMSEWHEIAGGEEGYKEMSEWALTNLSPDDLAKVNEGLTSSNNLEVTNTIQSLYINYRQQGGKSPSLISGDNSMGTSGVKPIQSTYELTQLMSNPKYVNHDVAYHKMVQDRLSVSTIV